MKEFYLVQINGSGESFVSDTDDQLVHLKKWRDKNEDHTRRMLSYTCREIEYLGNCIVPQIVDGAKRDLLRKFKVGIAWLYKTMEPERCPRR
jgi:hypothetical protein